jgi:hypothetical protein
MFNVNGNKFHGSNAGKDNALRRFRKNVIDNSSNMAKLHKISMEKYPSPEGGYVMFTVTDKAAEVIKDFLKDKNTDSAVRITLSFG